MYSVIIGLLDVNNAEPNLKNSHSVQRLDLDTDSTRLLILDLNAANFITECLVTIISDQIGLNFTFEHRLKSYGTIQFYLE